MLTNLPKLSCGFNIALATKVKDMSAVLLVLSSYHGHKVKDWSICFNNEIMWSFFLTANRDPFFVSFSVPDVAFVYSGHRLPVYEVH